MNPPTTNEILTLDASVQPTHRRRTGQIARLPKSVRDHLNEMIQDGVPYLDIIQKLGPEGQGLTEDMLTRR